MTLPPLNKPVLSANLLLFKDFEEAAHAFDAAAIPFLALKGIVFARELYPRPDMRAMEDIDLLIRPPDAYKARRLLAELGYAPKPDDPHAMRRGRTELDVESGIWYLDKSGVEALWRRALTVEEDGSSFRSPSWEDHLIHVVAHCAVHHAAWDASDKEDLRRLLDLPLDYAAVARRLRRARLGAAFTASLRALKLKTPPELASALPAAGGIEERLFLSALSHGANTGLGHLLRLWTAPNRLHAVGRWLFPERDFLRRRYMTEYPLLYLFFRPPHLLYRALRALLSNGSDWICDERNRAPRAEPPAPAASRIR
ncbi:MAG: nucleotidyltransferase family protein [Elusimicrobiota bacterium]